MVLLTLRPEPTETVFALAHNNLFVDCAATSVQVSIMTDIPIFDGSYFT